MEKHTIGHLALTAALLAGSTLASHASLINVGDSLNITGTINTSLADTGYVSYNQGASENVYAGVFSVQVDNLSQNNNTFNIGTFCTDVGVNWNTATTAYTAKSFSNSDGVNPAWSDVPEAIKNVAYIYNQYYLPAVTAGTLTADQAAGMQLAIWKVLYDTSSSANYTVSGTTSTFFTTGLLRASGFGGGLTDAEGYVSDVNTARSGGNFPAYTDTWLDPVNGNSQGLIWNNTTPVPEPTTLIAGALLLLPFGASTLRFVRRNIAA